MKIIFIKITCTPNSHRSEDLARSSHWTQENKKKKNYSLHDDMLQVDLPTSKRKTSHTISSSPEAAEKLTLWNIHSFLEGAGVGVVVTYTKISRKNGEPQRYSWGTQKKKNGEPQRYNWEGRRIRMVNPRDIAGEHKRMVNPRDIAGKAGG